MNQNGFAPLKLKTALLENLASLGYAEMTAVQAQSLPLILAGEDVITQAKTGSGKTAAFALGLLENLDVQRLDIQSLVLCPTRELADQVAKEIRKMARTIPNVKILTLCGGTPLKPQLHSLTYGAHIVVGTPGRIEDLMRRGALKLGSIHTLVLDEADRMLDMGFQAAMDTIIAETPKQRQTLLFSATFPDKIKSIAKKSMRKPKTVAVALTHSPDTICQHFYEVDSDASRLKALRLLLLQHQPESAVVFCNTKREAQDVTDQLVDIGFAALDLTGDLEQRDRDQTLIQFANKSITVLVATDVAARGLDIESLDMVINYHLAHDPESHVHRIGRTGRAGKKGMACTLFSAKDGYKITMLEDMLKLTVRAVALPDDDVLTKDAPKARMKTLQIGGGKKQKIRAGDILGALTAGQNISGQQVGKIHIADNWSYLAVDKSVLKVALRKLGDGKLKGRNYRVRVLGDGGSKSGNIWAAKPL